MLLLITTSFLGILLTVTNVNAQSCDYVAPIQVHYIPIAEDEMHTFFKTAYPDYENCQGVGFSPFFPNPGCSNSIAINSPIFDVSYPLNRYFSIGIAAANTIIYYDHWEDGYELDAENPTQSTTEIWGDGDLTNGVAPGYPADIFAAGDVIPIESVITGPPNAGTILYDGRDKLSSSFTITMTHFYYPTNGEGTPWPLIAGAAPILSTDEYGTSFTLPIGEDADFNQMFEHVGAFIQAGENGAVVNVDLDGDGVTDITYNLSEGETAYVNGGFQLGGTITSDNPITAQMQASDICSNYGTRSFLLFPDDQLSNAYVAMVGTPDDAGFLPPVSNHDATTFVYLYNPNNTAITVNWETNLGVQSPLVIPAGGQVKVPVPNTGAAMFESVGGEVFNAISTIDSPAEGVDDCTDYVVDNFTGEVVIDSPTVWDWGYTLTPIDKLGGQIPVVALAPGSDPRNNPITDNGAPIWLTAFYPPGSTSVGNITLCVDFDGDGGPSTDALGNGYDQNLVISELQGVRLYDADFDNSGTRIWVCDGSDAYVTAAWGEDPNTATFGAPSLDLGTTIIPGPAFQPTKQNELIADADGDGLFDIDVDTAEYCICVVNSGALSYDSLDIWLYDSLAVELTYVENSTYTVFGGVQTPVTDSGAKPFPLDENGFRVPYRQNPNDASSVCYSVTLNALPPGGTNVVLNEAVGSDGRSAISPESRVLVDTCILKTLITATGTCEGDDLTLIANNIDGASPYTYNWTGPNAFSSTAASPVIAGLAAVNVGTYNVTVTDNEGCTATSELAVATGELFYDIDAINPDCDGNLGSIDITVSSGVGPYTYYWEQDGTPITLEDDCSNGQFSFFDMEPIAGNQPTEAAINAEMYQVQGATLSVSPPILNGAGTTLDEDNIENTHLNTIYALRTGYSQTIQGGVAGANVTRTWSFSEPVCNATMFFNDLDRNDEVVINASLAGGAALDLTGAFTIADPANTCVSYTATNTWTSTCTPPTPNLNNSDDGGFFITFPGCIDEIEIVFYDRTDPNAGGTDGGSYSVNFEPICDYMEDYSDLDPGTYTIVVTDANGCAGTQTVILQEPNCTCDLGLTADVVQPNCDGSLGSIDITVTNGAPPYAYDWVQDNAPYPLDSICSNGQFTFFDFCAVANQSPTDFAINNETYIIQGATLTVSPPMPMGGAATDEDVINDSHLGGLCALRTGVEQTAAGSAGGQNMTRTWTFSQPVCDLNMFFNDLDRNDEVIINASLAGGAPIDLTSAFTIADPANTCVSYTGSNTWRSTCPPPAANLNNSDDGGFYLTFPGCIDEIEIIFYDYTDPNAGGTDGGSYSVNFENTCDYVEDLTDLNPGDYTVIVVDSLGCADTLDITIEEPDCIFDLALTKTLSTGQDLYIAPGDTISFDVTVTNQDTSIAYNVLVNDYVPAGYTFDPLLNPTWNVDSDGDGNPDQTIAGPVAQNQLITLPIILIVNDPFTGTQDDLVNFAEIASFEDVDGNSSTDSTLTDIDSAPDNDPVNDAGGTPGGPDDDVVTGDGTGAPGDSTAATDEDDQDPSFVVIFDLALTKMLSAGQSPYIAPGDTVSFDITVYNDGTVSAYNTLVNDYVPAGYTYDAALNPAWGDADADTNPDQTIAGPIAPSGTDVLTILLIVNDPYTGTQDDLVNSAEISASDDDTDPNNDPPVDADSTPDNTDGNDPGGTPGGPDDDFTGGDGTGTPGDSTAATDEDDQDPAFVMIFDLALTKTLSAGQSPYISPGDTVSFDITVTNQGTVDAYNTLVNDYVPAGYTYDAVLNPAWGDADADTNPDQTIAGPLAPGGTTTLSITLIVNDPYTGTQDDLVNSAEISSSDDDTDSNNDPPIDADSTPDNTDGNDSGGTPGGPDDDFIDGDGTGAPGDSTAATDEDDQDPAFVTIFDLALTKMLSAGQSPYIAPGDTVSFDITVYNDGTVSAYNTLVNDYVPAGYTYDAALNPAWGDADADTNPDQTIAGPIAPGGTDVLTILLIVNDPYTGTQDDLVNSAEISASDDDTDPNNDPPVDSDSTPDNTDGNDPGGTPGGPDDDFTGGDGTGAPGDSTAATDEDDQDPAFVTIFDLALTKTLSAGQSPYISPGDTVSFDITVTNQGTVDAYNTLVNDYVPAGYIYDAALNAAWGDADADTNPDQTIAGPLAPGGTTTLSITLIVNDPYTGTQDDLVNSAEVSSSDDDTDPNNDPPIDADSTPDNTDGNDPGGTPGGPDDDFIDGDGTGAPGDSTAATDEDDQDPAFVTIFDLALTKMLSAGQSPYIAPGDTVSFDITVYNDGTVSAYNTLVNDYVPAGYTYDAALNPAWGDADADTNPDQTIAGPIAPGGTDVLTILLIVNDPYTGTQDDLVNSAEISASDDDTDPNNDPPVDSDSTPDNTDGNDPGGTPGGPDDDFTGGDGTGTPGDSTAATDEDDQDPAFVTIFDLALTKMLSAGQSPYITPGDTVSFDITVYNDGTVPAYNTLVNDYVPAGYTYDAALNPAWGDADADTNPDQTIAGPIAPGGTTTLTIQLIVNSPFTGTQDDLVNRAEISSSDDDTDPNNDPPIDADSTPDNTDGNDAGGTPTGPDDDFTGGDGTGAPGDSTAATDEDDEDPAFVSIFDLALTKMLSTGQNPYISPGDTASFDIVVTNQGTVDAYNTLVNDYVPAGYTYDAALNPAWGDADADTNPDQTIAGPLAPGGTMTLTIQLIVNDPFTGTQADLVNSAEISASDDDTDPNNTPPTEADSTPDNTPGNDPGGTPGGPDDDFIDGDGTGMPGDSTAATDEDDEDPAFVSIFDLALTKTLSAGQQPFAAPGDTVSFDIEVFNQGTVDAYNTLVNDYLPAGYIFDAALNPTWSADSDGEGNPDITIVGPLAPGTSIVVSLQAIILDPFTADPQTDLINVAEISAIDDDTDPNNTPPTESDSTPDTDPTNDAGGTPDGPDDDFVDGDGTGMPLDSTDTTDEDDSDPAYVSLFDLALTKTPSAGQSNYVAYGDTITFDITVVNQAGPAYNILVNDYVPAGYTYDAALNPAWGDADGDGNPDQSVFELQPGADSTMVITLIVNDASAISSAADLTNVAEISDADDDTDPTNNPPVDSDSTPDNTPGNDAGGTPGGPDDDFVDGDGTGAPGDSTAATDEDDSDPALFDVFDLALTKTLSPGQSPYIQQGGTVSYAITVYNQGTVDAVDILVNDYVPAGMTFDAALNATWGDTDADGNPDTTIAGPIAPGASMTVTIILTVNDPYTGTPDDAINYAEITSADDDGDPNTPAPPDADSTPDNDPNNDPGGTPDGPDDDFVDGDGTGTPLDSTDTTDEDDADPTTVEIFDLALQKRLSVGQDQYVAPGDTVSFDITVSNQGFVDAYEVLVNDYVPSGYTYDPALNLGWGDTDADGNPDQTIAGPIIPGGTSTIQIKLIVNDPYAADPDGLVNYAEIGAADDDQDPNNDPPIDFDSDWDNDPVNDAGGTPGGPDDDFIDGDGSGSPLDSTDVTDEDDQDPAFISIFDLALTKTFSPGQSNIAAPGAPMSFDITVINQGSVAAYDVLVNDYIPLGYTYDAALNPAWGDADADGNPDQTVAGPIAPGGTTTLTIVLTVNNPFLGTVEDLVNVAEISSADDDGNPNTPAPEDVDSTPNNDPTDDAGGEPGTPSDDSTGGDGSGAPGDEDPLTDEDDQDPVFVDIFDVAMNKTLAPGQSEYIAPGDTVTYMFTVYNQGTTLVYNTLVNDFVPAGMTFDAALNTQWGDADLDGNPDRVVVGPLAPGGGSQSFLLSLIVNDPFTGTSDDLINYAEIASADDDDDTSTPPPTDIDSTPNNDPTDDAGGTPGGPDDDYVDGNGTGMPLDSTDVTDEDDQDPSVVNIFDLALTKTRSAGQGEYIAPGDNVSFDITVINQGTVDAYNVLINDYVPAGYTFDPALNATWNADSDGDGNPDQTITGPIAPNGGTMTVTIVLTVNDPFMGTSADLVNYAEIGAADDDTDPTNTPPTDYDSTPDTDPANDAGGTPDGPDDDYVDGDGSGAPLDSTDTTDEDDQDPAYANIFDLALTKTLGAGQSPYINPGDDISFDITVINQGTVDAYNVLVNDYVPAGMMYNPALNAAWGDADADGNPDQIIAGPVASGATMTLTIVLTVNDPFTGTASDLVNYAEIGAADDDTDPNNPPPTEADSTPDNNPTNDAGGTPNGPDDDFVDGDGTGSPLDSTDTTDEDDQDPAVVSIFDLALAKTLSAGQDPYIAPGDIVSFDITVYNQGTVDAYDVLVNDYVPAGMTFDAALNPTWGDADADGNPDQTVVGPIAPNGTAVLTIQLTINDPFVGTADDLVNVAEISAADDDGDPNTPPPADIDSDPNNDPADDAGGTPGGPDDDFVDGDGTGAPGDSTDTTDEDDQDPSFVSIFDLALTKALSAGQSEYITPGDDVSFDIVVYNQGTVDAYNTLVNDYVPAGYTFDPALNAAWADADADGNPDQTIAGPLAPGATMTLTIVLTVNDPFTGSAADLINVAEISSSDDDTDPTNTPPTEADSTPDNTPGNDAGGEPDSPSDDVVDGDGSGAPGDEDPVTDEDDSDPAVANIFDLALTKSLVAGQSQYISPGDVVTYNITVFNQGTVDAYDVLVNDYIPAGLTFDAATNPAWGDADADGNPDQTIAGPISPGGTMLLTITLTVNDPFTGNGDDLVNFAEISSADDDGDPNTPAPPDADSTPDNDPNNDPGGTPGGPDDDAVDGDGTGMPQDSTATTDEDDQDPAVLSIFDLALTKALSTGESPYLSQGDTISYDITVTNQGTVDAVNILVNEYIPSGLNFDLALNPAWGNADADTNPDQVIAGPLAPGASEVITIQLIVDNPFTGTQDDLINFAEISDADDDGDPSTPAPPDVDSTPDNDDSNDAGGTPNGPDDDAVDGDGSGMPQDSTDTTDEDDHDPAYATIFDLSLIKTLSLGQSQYIAPGDVVSFDVTVINDGLVDAYNVLVNDYIPNGYTYDPALNPGWGDSDADGNPDRTIIGPIIPGGTVTSTIVLTVNDPFDPSTMSLVNYGEISDADDDLDPNNDPPIDSDSTPDNDPTNDAGGTPGGPDDDATGGDGSGTPLDGNETTDEDDQDPATVSIFDLALTKSLSADQSSTVGAGDNVSFDITVINQGTVNAYDVLVNDYVPSGYTFDVALNPGWADFDLDGNPDQTVAGPLAPGATQVLTIVLTVNDPFNGTAADLINYAEISSADDDGEISTPAPDDVDSTPDNDPNNDPGGTPDGPDDGATGGDGSGTPNDGNPATDEDDSDPATVDIFDMALTKSLSPGQSQFVAAGDTVSFDITLYNQGTVDAYNTLVNDYVPAGYTFDAALNPQWGDNDLDGNPDRIIFGPLLPNTNFSFEIMLIINDPFNGTPDDLVNVAEITEADDDGNPATPPPSDIDSDPDNDPTNDPGGTPNGPDDDAIDGNGTGTPQDGVADTDEDDSDPATVVVGGFDLALTKSLSAGQSPYVSPGDNVSFDITVINQGAIDAYNILVNDYVPAGYTFDAALNAAWTDSDADGNPDQTIAGVLIPGDSQILTIVLTVNDPFIGTAADLVNFAEISAADNDTDPNNTPPTDTDSTPDTDPANDAGGTPGSPNDDFTGGDGTGTPGDEIAVTDEDDSDPATVSIFDLALTKSLSVGQSPYAGPGDDVSFDIVVTNQGGVDAYNVLVNDYVPTGYTFDAALNAGWADADADGNPDWTIAGPIAPGTTETLTIVLTINDPFTGTAADLVNVAEISAADDDTDPTNTPPTDGDSTPNNDPTDDAGGEPDSPSDDATGGDGSGAPGDEDPATDEDDSDPATVSIFDLALTKALSTGQSPYVGAGDEVSFDIVVTNQGSVNAYNVVINDYVPAGYTFDAALNAGWSADSDGDGNPDWTIVGPIAPGVMTTLTIVLTVNDPFTGTVADLINVAEISAADDDTDPNNTPPTDTDSTPDTDPGNDPGGEPGSPSDGSTGGDGSGAPGDEDPTTDEDDSDPAVAMIFDLALTKTLSAGQSQYIAPGDDVSFDITVINQGTVDAYSVLVNEYIPSGYTFDAALNPTWADADADGNPDQTIIGPLAPGGTMTLTIVLTVNDPFTGTAVDLVNVAEISAADDDTDPNNTPPTDADSDPNNDPTDDAGGEPGTPSDDSTGGDGSGGPGDEDPATDEDDSDPAIASIFDLALTKALSTGQSQYIGPGDDVSFDILVTNQGTVGAYDVLVNDYVPAGMSFNATLNPAWSADSDGDGNPDQTIPGRLAPGASTTLTIVLTVNDPFTGTAADLINVAEISAADDNTDPNDTPPTDADSTPDTDPGNDPGGEPGSPSDDSTGGDGSGNPGDTDPATDEDDQDPAIASIFDLALTKAVSAGQSTQVAPGDTVSYDIAVINQGTVDAYNIEVNDYTPTGMVFNLALNPGWGDTDSNGIPEYTIAGPLAPGTTQVVSIQLVIADPFDPNTMSTVNIAEIGAADDDGDPNTPPPSDTDSTPNDDPTDDAGGEPGSPSDDSTGGDGSGTPGDTDPTTDEDDSDPAEVSVATFDLALMKTYDSYLDNDASQAISPGDDVRYTITVYNQGTIDATDVEVTDYVPAGMMFIPFFNTDFSGAAPAVTADIPFIAAGTSESVEITLRIDPGFSGFEIINNAEVTSADNEFGIPDEDSTPGDNSSTPSETDTDNDVNDDCGCAPGSSDNPMDNDDYDPATIEVQPILPIELTYIKGTEEDCEVFLSWGTASEINVSHFEIQKSTDGVTFSTIDRLAPLGGEGIATDYTYTDTQIASIGYYRLKVVDLDGSIEYSDIVTIQANCATGVSISDVFPNPVVNDVVKVRFSSTFDHEAARVIVTDMLGRQMMEMPITVFEGSNLISVDPSRLPAATYVLTIQGNNWRSTAMRFVKLNK